MNATDLRQLADLYEQSVSKEDFCVKARAEAARLEAGEKERGVCFSPVGCLSPHVCKTLVNCKYLLDARSIENASKRSAPSGAGERSAEAEAGEGGGSGAVSGSAGKPAGVSMQEFAAALADDLMVALKLLAVFAPHVDAKELVEHHQMAINLLGERAGEGWAGKTCAGGVLLSKILQDGPCPKCGATEDDACPGSPTTSAPTGDAGARRDAIGECVHDWHDDPEAIALVLAGRQIGNCPACGQSWKRSAPLDALSGHEAEAAKFGDETRAEFNSFAKTLVASLPPMPEQGGGAQSGARVYCGRCKLPVVTWCSRDDCPMNKNAALAPLLPPPAGAEAEVERPLAARAYALANFMARHIVGTEFAANDETCRICIAFAENTLKAACADAISAMSTGKGTGGGEFQRGIKIAYDVLQMKIANNWHPNAEQQKVRDIWNEALGQAADDILRCAPDYEAQWKTLADAEARIADLERERDAWEKIAAQHCRNEMYYRGLLTQIGEKLGPAAYTSDDGSVQQDVLCIKVPELVDARIKQLIDDWDASSKRAGQAKARAEKAQRTLAAQAKVVEAARKPKFIAGALLDSEGCRVCDSRWNIGGKQIHKPDCAIAALDALNAGGGSDG